MSLGLFLLSPFVLAANEGCKPAAPDSKLTRAKVAKPRVAKRNVKKVLTPILASNAKTIEPAPALVLQSPVVVPKPESLVRVSLHVGKAAYIKSGKYEKYLNTGLSIEQSAMLFPDSVLPKLVIGLEWNQYTSYQHMNLYDLISKVGPKFCTEHLELDLQGLAGMTANNKGETSVDAGGQVKFGLNSSKGLSPQFFMARTHAFSKFGLSIGYFF